MQPFHPGEIIKRKGANANGLLFEVIACWTSALLSEKPQTGPIVIIGPQNPLWWVEVRPMNQKVLKRCYASDFTRVSPLYLLASQAE